MKRRKFIQYFRNISGAAFVGIPPVALYRNHQSESSFGKEDNTRVTPERMRPETGKIFSELRHYNGKPTVFVNGKPYFPMAFISYYPKQFRYKRIRESGIRFFSLSITLGDRFVAAYRKGKVRLDKKGIWDSPDQIDINLLDMSVNEILDVAPDAFIFPRVFCDSPGWWDSFHPAETSRTNDGLPLRQSFSSLIWRKETAEVLRKIVRHISQSSYADRIIGIHVTAGETEESAHHDWSGCVDYSLAAQRNFRHWLLRKYNRDERLIETLFNQKIDQISIPSPELREKAEFGNFYDPQKSGLIIDYNIFKGEEVVESLDFLCKAVKEESNGSLLTGVFYGYTLVEWRDHLALSLLLKSPYIDFLSSTNGGGKKTIIGEHDMHFLTETDSIQKSNKLFYYEADTRTCMSRWISELQPDVDPYHEYDSEGWLGPETIEKSLELLKAVFSRVICTGSANWWFDLWGGWYDNEKILNLFSGMQKVGDESIHLPRGSVSQVCVIVQEKALLYYATASRKTTWIGQQMSQIGKLGAPYDIYLFDDILHMDFSKYKTIIFLNTFLLSNVERLAISQKCMCDNRYLLWLYTPGMIGDKIAVSNVASLVNMDVNYDDNHIESEINVKLPDRELTYTGAKVSPFLYIKSGSDHIYGWTKDEFAVLGEKKEKDYSTVLACAPPVPWQVIQYYAMKAGVHIYSTEGDVVYANQSYLSVSSLTAGKKKISLPEKCQLVEFPGNGNTANFNKEHEIDFLANSCHFFKIVKKGSLPK